MNMYVKHIWRCPSPPYSGINHGLMLVVLKVFLKYKFLQYVEHLGDMYDTCKLNVSEMLETRREHNNSM